jgi:hypothetical protein
MKNFLKLFTVGYFLTAALFFLCGIALIGVAAYDMWQALSPFANEPAQPRFIEILECVGVLTIAVASLELGQTVLEEEVQRSANISAPTRVRRFLSRFLIVVIVSLSIECLVSVFQFVHGRPEHLLQATSIGVAAAILLAAWGIFVHYNVEAEKLEPHAMKEATQEDQIVDT